MPNRIQLSALFKHLERGTEEPNDIQNGRKVNKLRYYAAGLLLWKIK